MPPETKSAIHTLAEAARKMTCHLIPCHEDAPESKLIAAVEPALSQEKQLREALKNMVHMWEFLEPSLRAYIAPEFLYKANITVESARKAIGGL